MRTCTCACWQPYANAPPIYGDHTTQFCYPKKKNPTLPALMLFVLICVYLGLVFPPGKCCARKRWAGGVIDAQGNSTCTRKTQTPLCPAPIPSPVKCLFVFYLICLVDCFFGGRACVLSTDGTGDDVGMAPCACVVVLAHAGDVCSTL